MTSDGMAKSEREGMARWKSVAPRWATAMRRTRLRSWLKSSAKDNRRPCQAEWWTTRENVDWALGGDEEERELKAGRAFGRPGRMKGELEDLSSDRAL